MTQQIKWCGGSVVLVERYYEDGKQKEKYIIAIEPKTTKARLEIVRKTYFSKKWKPKSLSTSRTGYRMPKKSEPIVKGKRHILPRPMHSETPHTQTMMERQKVKKPKKTVTYNVKDLKTLQENETDISIYKTRLSKKIKPDERRALIVSISVLKKENKMILKSDHKTGKDIAEDRKRGRVIVTDSEGWVY